MNKLTVSITYLHKTIISVKFDRNEMDINTII